MSDYGEPLKVVSGRQMWKEDVIGFEIIEKVGKEFVEQREIKRDKEIMAALDKAGWNVSKLLKMALRKKSLRHAPAIIKIDISKMPTVTHEIQENGDKVEHICRMDISA